MADKNIPIRFTFRSPPMIEMLTIMERKGFWERYGLDVRRCEFLNDARGSEELLFADEIDLIFGNHLTPYWRIHNGPVAHSFTCGMGRPIAFKLTSWAAALTAICWLPECTTILIPMNISSWTATSLPSKRGSWR